VVFILVLVGVVLFVTIATVDGNVVAAVDIDILHVYDGGCGCGGEVVGGGGGNLDVVTVVVFVFVVDVAAVALVMVLKLMVDDEW
jgi:hypothetical protein